MASVEHGQGTGSRWPGPTVLSFHGGSGEPVAVSSSGREVKAARSSWEKPGQLDAMGMQPAADLGGGRHWCGAEGGGSGGAVEQPSGSTATADLVLRTTGAGAGWGGGDAAGPGRAEE